MKKNLEVIGETESNIEASVLACDKINIHYGINNNLNQNLETFVSDCLLRGLDPQGELVKLDNGGSVEDTLSQPIDNFFKDSEEV